MTKRYFYKDKNVKIFIDSNVLRNFCTAQSADVECLHFLFEKRKRNTLFTSTLSIGQTLSHYKKSDFNKAVEMGRFFNERITFIDFAENDVMQSFLESGKDLEDNMQYVCSQKGKNKCGIIISNDRNGFADFTNVVVVKPNKLGTLRHLID